MSTLQVANVYLESTGNNRIQYAGSNSYTLYAGGIGTLAVNTTALAVTGVAAISGNTTTTNITASANVNMAVANVTSNTLTLGTSSITANGYSRLPNGLLMQWGNLLANASTPAINFPTAFAAGSPWSISATANIAGGAGVGIYAYNTTTATIRTTITGSNAFVTWIAIGI